MAHESCYLIHIIENGRRHLEGKNEKTISISGGSFDDGLCRNAAQGRAGEVEPFGLLSSEGDGEGR